MEFLVRLRAAIRVRLADRPVFDATRFGDPLASRIEWGPMVGGGSNFRTHNGGLVSPNRFEFRASAGLLLFAAVFAAIGAGFGFLLFTRILPDADDPVLHLFLLLPAAFLVAAWIIGWHMGRPAVFDRTEGWFWKGRQAPSGNPAIGSGRNACPLVEIKALQIVSENIRSKNSTYSSWELNLVLADGTRRNVVDHGAGEALLRDANELASFLSVPLWNKSDGFRPPSPPG